MSTEQPNEDGKIDVQINFHRLPFALRSDPLIVAAQSEWAQTLSKSLTSQLHGRIDREGKFTEACPTTAPIIDFKEGDNAADSVRDVMDRWLAALVWETPASMPEMELSPEIVQNVLNATGVDLSHYTVTDVQYNAPSVFNITLR